MFYFSFLYKEEVTIGLEAVLGVKFCHGFRVVGIAGFYCTYYCVTVVDRSHELFCSLRVCIDLKHISII